jgi:heat shock protein HtpX
MVVQMTISRRNEFEADEGGALICGKPLALASALRKIEAIATRQPMNVSPSAAHMAIINPLAGARQGFTSLFRTHPPTEDRIARLEQLHQRGPAPHRTA